MPKYYDAKTKTLFVTKGGTERHQLSDNPLIKIVEDTVPILKLRRQMAGFPRFFVSTESSTIVSGNFDLSDKSNRDLLKVETEIFCP